MDDEAMRWTMRRCDGAMLPHRRIVHSITMMAEKAHTGVAATR